MRTSRIRTATLAAVTAALALGLTACGGADADSKAAGGDTAAGSAQSQSASNGGGKGGAEQANPGGDTKEGARPTAASDGAAGKGTTAGAQQCRGDEMLLTAVHQLAGQQGDHLLVTASNKGTKPCWVTSYPAVKLGDGVDGAALPHSKKDNAGGGQHITLQPGGTAYSAVNLFDYGSKNHTAQSFALALRGADGHSGPSYSVAIKGEKPQFSWNEADVLNWSTKKPYDF
ncbi:hypothetical protein Sgleb_18470 [Streptomyces glebosus]|uniref:DUF4232 domain-containing protein n=1 Tax=Streptomyces glebosus TaxID=249580 RepID=A0A640SS15_9ACTN|nr:DUF4232 domain-containing protein [Streptomyces glebosus]GFE13800.1 hypothetical protein Sgleb_18470 [Streptomyces glebosus]GHG82231.1 hypothetical protein GCM10010513_61120 [Streptomyces glebosus]